MIKHIVMFKLFSHAEGGTKAENIEKMKTMLEALPAKLNVIKSFEVGVNYYQSDRAYDVALTASFETKDDLEIYRNHPEHIKCAEFILKIRETAWMVDYEVE